MKPQINPLLVGSLVLGVLALGATSVLALRPLKALNTTGRFTAHFNESVQGLDEGSSVRLQGVLVGRVVSIRVNYDETTHRAQAIVTGELDRNLIHDHAGHPLGTANRTTIEGWVKAGLRAKIDLVGITGLQFVALEFEHNRPGVAAVEPEASEYPVVPTVRSGLSELVVNLSRSATNLANVDFVDLSIELKKLLSVANQQAAGLDLKTMVARITAAAASVDGLVKSKDATATLQAVGRAAESAQHLADNLAVRIDPTGAEILSSLRSFQKMTEGVRQLLQPDSELSSEAASTLQRWGDAAESIERLSSFLERNPNALILGRTRTRAKATRDEP